MSVTIDSRRTKLRKDLILLKDLSREEIVEILDRGDYWADNPNSRISNAPKSVDNPIICNLILICIS